MGSTLRALAVAATLAAAGCSYTVPKVDQVHVDESRLDSSRPMPKLACAYRLANVLDGRADSDDGGRLGTNVLHLEDAAGVITRQLQDAGLTPADSGAGRALTVELKQLYMAQNLDVKIPVAVYSAQLEGEAPFFIRSQSSNLNWAGTKGEAARGYGRALADANYRLLQSLNQRCPKG